MITISMRCSYDTAQWPEGSDEPITTHGYTDPSNPWGGWQYEIPDGLVGEAFTAWQAENAETLTFNNLLEAAQFVADFPGAVWDYSDAVHETQPDGSTLCVWLHVEGWDTAVFAIARAIEAAADRNLAKFFSRKESA